MAWADGAITQLQELSHHLDQLKHLAILCSMIAIQGLILIAFVVWATRKFWSLARKLLE
jgi:hypothetical protein